MKRTLDQMIQMAELGNQMVDTGEIIKHFVFRPKTKEGKEAVMEGNYPKDFGLFVCLFATCENDSEIMHTSWYKDKKNPKLFISIRTKL